MTTTLEHANIVGNVYFAHYAAWLGESIDRGVNGRVPELLRERGDELRCLRARLDYLREAMPFDELAVNLRLEQVGERGLVLRGDVFRESEKLASGRLSTGWFAPDDAGRWSMAELPRALRDG